MRALENLENGSDKLSNKRTCKFNLIDLAGSERQKSTGTVGKFKINNYSVLLLGALYLESYNKNS